MLLLCVKVEVEFEIRQNISFLVFDLYFCVGLRRASTVLTLQLCTGTDNPDYFPVAICSD